MWSRTEKANALLTLALALAVIGISLLLFFTLRGPKSLPSKAEPEEKATIEKPIMAETPVKVEKPIIVTVEKLEKIGYFRPYWQARVKHADGATEILRLDDGLQTAIKDGNIYEIECTGVRMSFVVAQSYRYIHKIVREVK